MEMLLLLAKECQRQGITPHLLGVTPQTNLREEVALLNPEGTIFTITRKHGHGSV